MSVEEATDVEDPVLVWNCELVSLRRLSPSLTL